MSTEAKVGLFFFAGLGLLLWFTIFVTGVGSNQRTYEIRFDRVANLKAGDAVLYNGVRVGTISDVTPVLNGEGESEVAVFFDIEPRMREAALIGEGVEFTIKQGMLGGGSLSIIFSGQGDPLEPGLISAHRGQEPVDLGVALGRVVELIDDNRDYFHQTMRYLPVAAENAAELTAELRDLTAENRSVLNQAIAAMRDMATSIETLVSANRESLTQSSQRLAELLGEVHGLVEENRGDVRATIAILPETAQRFTNLAESLQETIAENRERIDRIMSGLADFTPRLQSIGEDVEQITGAIAQGQGSVGKLIFDDQLYQRSNQMIGSIQQRVDEVESFTASMATTRLYGGTEGGYNSRSEVGRGSVYLRLEPKPWKYYQVGLAYRSDPLWQSERPDFIEQYLIDQHLLGSTFAYARYLAALEDLADRDERYNSGLRAVDPHLAIGYRFFADDNIERYRLDLAAGLFDGQPGARAGLALSQSLDFFGLVRMSDDRLLPNRLKRERAPFVARSWFRWQPLEGMFLELGADDLVRKPGPYAGLRFEILDRDLVNLFTVAGGL